MVIQRADHVITATSLMVEHFAQLYPGTKFTSITNGYDEDDFKNTAGLSPGKEFIIAYTGIFNKEQNPQKFFKAVHDAIQKRDDIKEHFKLRIIGQLDNPGDFENMIYFKKLGLDKYSELIPYLAHKQVIIEMCRATVLLLLVGEYPYNEGILTGKIFEYLRSGRPTLAVVPPNGLAADVIKDTNSGLVVSNEYVEEISNSILHLFDMFMANKLEDSFSRVGIDKYNRKNLTQKLSEIFSQCVHFDDNPPKQLQQER
jgi:glycosyltransferase involved in cell wall biosynthesis